MDGLGYIISNKFIVIAADTNLILTVDDGPFETAVAEKVHRINDDVFISIIGDPYKISDVQLFTDILNELRPGESYDEIAENIKSTFKLTNSEFDPNTVESLKKRVLSIYKEGDSEAEVKAKLLALLEDDPDTQAFTQDALSLNETGLRSPTTILLFGIDRPSLSTRASKSLLIGHYLKGSEMLPINKDSVILEVLNSTQRSNYNQQLSIDLLKELQPFIVAGWEDSNELTALLMEAGKKLLKKGIGTLNPFTTIPNIVFYELSADTDYQFKEPDLQLKRIVVKRK